MSEEQTFTDSDKIRFIRELSGVFGGKIQWEMLPVDDLHALYEFFVENPEAVVVMFFKRVAEDNQKKLKDNLFGEDGEVIDDKGLFGLPTLDKILKNRPGMKIIKRVIMGGE